MKRTFRMLSFILAFCMILTSMQVPAYAGEISSGDISADFSGSFDVSGNVSENEISDVSVNEKDDSNTPEVTLDDSLSDKKTDVSENNAATDVSFNNPDVSSNIPDVSDNDFHGDVSENNAPMAEGNDISGNDAAVTDSIDVSENEGGDISGDDEEVPETGAGEIYRYSVDAPVFSVPSSSVREGQRVLLTCTTNGAEIYYTTDGKTKPSKENGTLYEDAFVINSAVTIKAIAIKEGYNSSAVVTVSYSIKNESDVWGDIAEDDRIPFSGNADFVPKSLWVTGVTNIEYSGKANTFSGLRVYSHKTLLVKNKDYTVKYSSNTNVGTGTVTITGKGNYTGTITKTFKITPISIGNEDGNSENLSAPDITYAYTGKTKKGTTNVTYKLGDKWVSLKKDKDFSFSYTKGDSYKAAGEHLITIVGKGNYTGTAVFKEYISSEKIIISSLTFGKIKNVPFNSSACEPDVKIKDGEYVLENGLDYELEYQNNDRPGTATVIVTGRGNYAGTKVITFKITTASISTASVAGITAKEYSGSTATQTGYTLTYKANKSAEEEILAEGTDYTVSYKNAVNAGKKATIVFTGINRFSGSLSKTFTIKARVLSEEFVLPAEIGEVQYQKGGTTPNITVNDAGRTLKAGTDYTIAFSNNKSVNDGTKEDKLPTVTITGKGNYKGTVSKTFTIAASTLNNARMTASDVVFSEKAGACKPSIALYDTNGAQLKAGTDYDKNNITYTYVKEVMVKQQESDGSFSNLYRDENEEVDVARDIIPVGTEIKATVYGKGNYSGTEQFAFFRVVTANLSSAKVKIKTRYFTGEAVELDKSDITVTINKKPLGKNDYEIIGYSNNLGKGTASVTLRGTGNYGGTKKCSFTISTKSVQYQVKYDKNDDYMNEIEEDFETYATGTMKAVDLSSGKAITKNAFKRDGYVFTGWNTKPDGSGDSFANKAKLVIYSNDVIVYGVPVTLYAQWEVVKYSITYALPDKLKIQEGENATEYTIRDTVVLNPIERECYYFKNWYADSKYKKTVNEIKPGTTGNLTVYGKLSPFKYTIKFNANGGSGKMTSLTDCAYGTSYVLSDATFTRTNYRFLSWNTKADGTGTKYKANAKVSKLCKEDGGTVVLYAQWEAYTEQYIWDVLMDAIGNEFGVAGLMGNLFAESGLKSNNLQNTYEKSLGYTDDEYTKAVDNGKYTRDQFVNDRAGYGLAQWTSAGRKAGLYDMAKAMGRSIADLGVQIAYLLQELRTGYSNVLNVLKSAKSVKEASDIVLTKFERPADQSDSAKNRRAGYGEMIYEKYVNSSKEPDKNEMRVITNSALNVRSGPGTDNKIVMTLPNGTICTIVEVKSGAGSLKGWGKLKDGTGWISLDWVTEVK